MDDAVVLPIRPSRRELLRGAATLGAGLALAACGEGLSPAPSWSPRLAASFWRPDGWLVHDTVDASLRENGFIRARLQGQWQAFPVRSLPAEFMQWSLSGRLAKLDELAVRGFDPSDLDGPHNACVATFGGPADDSFTSLNTAYKGLGFLPRPERLGEALAWIRSPAGGSSMDRALGILAELYREDDLFDPRCQISLELFATATHTTHTLKNMLAHPVASASFLAFPTYELRCVPQLLHPANPDLSAWERRAVAWANGVHDLVHGGGGSGGGRIACVYHVVEVYDDTPRPGAGVRLK